MGSGFEHAALAVFTTLAPMGAASFIALAYAFATGKIDDDAAKRVDKMTAIPAVVMLVGFIGSFMHLASPFAAFGVFGGLAYMMDTIPTWNTPVSIVQMLGYAIAGGAVLGFTISGFARVELPENAAKIALGIVSAGVVVGVAGLAVQFAGLGSIRNIWGPASDLVPAFGLIIALYAVCGIAAAALVALSCKKKSPALAAAACVIIAVGIFFARIAFYGTYMGIAL